MSLSDSAPSDARLIRRIAAGDVEALGAFYDSYSTPLYSIALHILKDPCDAEDILQEVFVTLWQKAHAFDESLGKPVSWVVRITRNEAIDRLRTRKRETQRNGTGFDPSAVIETVAAPPPAETLEVEHVDLIRAEVGKLPDNQRQAIEMAFFGGLSHGEIAGVLRQPLGTIKARIRRGMMSLRDVLEFKEPPTMKRDLGKHPIALTAESNTISIYGRHSHPRAGTVRTA